MKKLLKKIYFDFFKRNSCHVLNDPPRKYIQINLNNS